MTVSYEPCKACNAKGFIRDFHTQSIKMCTACDGCGDLPAEYEATPLSASVRDPDGRLIRAATDVARAQRAKGIAKYKSTLEDQNGYTIGGMIDMVAEELADGSVYVQKVREMYLSLLDELEAALYIHAHGDADRSDTDRITDAMRIISRERGNV